MLVVVLVALALAALASCTATIVPPRQVHEPRTVYLLDHGRTSSLVLPHNDGFIRYAYGEHRWYALEETGPLRAFGAMLWPTQGTLGRKRLAIPPSGSTSEAAEEASIRSDVRVPIEAVYPVRVEAERVAGLREALADRFDAAAAEATVVHTPARDLRFVPASPRYHLLHNSNHATADWLEQLDCEVRGPTVLSKWRVEPTEP